MKNYSLIKKNVWENSHLRYIIITLFITVVFYYLPIIFSLAGWAAGRDTLAGLHDFYGIDFFGILFFAPVVYAAYVLGVVPAVLTALVAMLMILPYTILLETYPNALFKPTAFVIILSAVGAVVAMVQKSEIEHRQRMKEMKCLYDIGKTAGESASTGVFLNKVVELVRHSMHKPEETGVMIKFRGSVYYSSGFQKYPSKITEDLVISDESPGSIEIYSTRDNPYLKKKNHLTKTLAERISGAIRELELANSLRSYYQQLEDEVEKRTKDLEHVQEKLIRSERLAAVGELASGVGHELRNPLNVIRNCAYLLSMTLNEKGDEEANKTLKVLDKQIDVSNKIVTDLLDFTRITPPSPTRIDLSSIIKEAISWVEIPDNVHLRNNLNGHSFQVRADAEQTGRAFANIVSNAIQAMNSGGELRIDAGEDESYVWASFSDTGPGILPENMEKIFEPLFTTKPKGIGLGLAITKRLVEQNGGKIEVASRVNEGTTFTIKLPHEKRI